MLQNIPANEELVEGVSKKISKDESDSRVQEDLMKIVIQSVISHVDNDNTGDVEINYIAGSGMA